MTELKIKTIDVHEFKKRYDANPNLCLIDVRELDEWESVRIPGALHIPKGNITQCIEHEIPQRECPIYLHCRGGVRSLEAAHWLTNMGYQEVYSIDGGITQWELCGYLVERKLRSPNNPEIIR